MVKLTQEHLDFLEKHQIPIEEVFDASGMRHADYKKRMKEQGFLLAYGVTPCQKANHTLRTRHNHCVMCDPSKISYVKRKHIAGFVYVAISSKERLVKIGCAKNYQNRISSLNRQNYGDINDWQLVAYFYHDKMGEAEHNIQKEFEQYREYRTFDKEGEIVQASEIFRINLKDVFGKASELGYAFDYINHDLIKQYNIGVSAESHKAITQNVNCEPVIPTIEKQIDLDTQDLENSISRKPILFEQIVEIDPEKITENSHDNVIVGVSDSSEFNKEIDKIDELLGNDKSSSANSNTQLDNNQDVFKTNNGDVKSVSMVQGRLRRLSYIPISFLVLFLGGSAMISVDEIALKFVFWFITMSIQSFFSAKRLQDANIHPGWAIIAFIPYIAILGWIFLIFMPGTKGVNRFGENPRV